MIELDTKFPKDAKRFSLKELMQQTEESFASNMDEMEGWVCIAAERDFTKDEKKMIEEINDKVCDVWEKWNELMDSVASRRVQKDVDEEKISFRLDELERRLNHIERALRA